MIGIINFVLRQAQDKPLLLKNKNSYLIRQLAESVDTRKAYASLSVLTITCSPSNGVHRFELVNFYPLYSLKYVCMNNQTRILLFGRPNVS